mmetsp:Transcript_36011/g.31777  ORF Transcript_36011/g.31777 Transcript_36011/m.31777 type:complete len:122 (-) Transcript_36011:71-436(-)
MSNFIIINPANVYRAIKTTWGKYRDQMPIQCKLIDIYIVYIILTAFMQILYAVVIGTTYPFNSLLSGLSSCVGSFVLAVSLRLQINQGSVKREFAFSQERAFADFIIGNVILHFIVISYLG